MGNRGSRAKADPYAQPAPRRQGCCATVSRVVCQALLSVLFLAIFALSIAALVGRRQYWTYYTTNRSDPGAYYVSTGWLSFFTRDTPASYLWDIRFGLWVIGIICAAALAVSIVLSFAEFFASVTDQCGRHTAGLAYPMGIVLLGILLAYIADAVIRVRDYTANNTGTAMTPWPSWGWICAIVAAALWFVVGACASCMGVKGARPVLPTHTHDQAAYPAAYPAKEKRGWFGGRKNRGAAAAGTGAGAGAAAAPTEYRAEPFNQPTGPARDVEMAGAGNNGVRNNGHHGNTGEVLAVGAGGAAAGAAAHHHQRNETEKPKRRGLFSFGKKQPEQREPAPAQQDPAGERDYGAGQRDIGTGQRDYGTGQRDIGTGQREYSTGQPAAGGTPGGAWAGSRLSDEANKGANIPNRDAPVRDAPVEPSAPAMPPSSAAPQKKGGPLSFYH
ncbi:g4840 [Coccomyxa elongata]